MLDENSAIPLYRQLYQIFQENIAGGEWKADVRIPTELELCQQYGVSRMTVRLALEELKLQGRLYRKQGRGTFIIEPKMEQGLSSFYSFGKGIDNCERTITNKLISFKVLSSAVAVAALQLSENDLVFCIQRLRCTGDISFALESSYVPCTVCPNLTAEIIIENGLYNSLKILAGIIPDTAKESFEAVLINKSQADALQISENQPALHIERITSANGAFVEYCDSIVRGDRLKYNIVLR